MKVQDLQSHGQTISQGPGAKPSRPSRGQERQPPPQLGSAQACAELFARPCLALVGAAAAAGPLPEVPAAVAPSVVGPVKLLLAPAAEQAADPPALPVVVLAEPVAAVTADREGDAKQDLLRGGAQGLHEVLEKDPS